MEGILIPVKSLERAKARLAQTLPPPARRRLGLAMLADVLRAIEKWEPRFIVTADPDAEAVGMAFGARIVADPGGGLNRAVGAGTAQALEEGISTLLVVPADAPLITSFDVTTIFSTAAPVVVVPAEDGGTNALLRRPPGVIEPAFGSRSAVRHAREARLAGQAVKVLALESFQLDVDTPEDLERLAAAGTDRESVRLAREVL